MVREEAMDMGRQNDKGATHNGRGGPYKLAPCKFTWLAARCVTAFWAARQRHDWVVVGATPEQMLELGYLPVGRDFRCFAP